MNNPIKVAVLWQLSCAFCVVFILLFSFTSLLAFAQARMQTYRYPSDSVSQAEHEQLKAVVQQSTAGESEKIAVLQQRVTDDEKTIATSAATASSAATTINRMEGIGVSFGVILTIVQFLLFRAHREKKEKAERADD